MALHKKLMFLVFTYKCHFKKHHEINWCRLFYFFPFGIQVISGGVGCENSGNFVIGRYIFGYSLPVYILCCILLQIIHFRSPNYKEVFNLVMQFWIRERQYALSLKNFLLSQHANGTTMAELQNTCN